MIVYDPKRRVPNWVPGSWQYLETLLKRNMRCFEWGGGQSTLWLAERVPSGMVLTVESNVKWLQRIHDLTANLVNCDILWAPRESERYRDSVDLAQPVDVYLIDGFQRIACLKLVLEECKTGNIIVMDDALDYAGDWKPPGVEVFSMPHPYAGKKVTRNPWGNTLLKVGDLHHETKETWIWKV